MVKIGGGFGLGASLTSWACPCDAIKLSPKQIETGQLPDEEEAYVLPALER